MGRKISDIYNEYKTMSGIQEHMFRVAAVASLICDNFNELLPKEEIVTACLFHDMGNIVKSELEYFPKFLTPQGLEYWQKAKDEYIKKYGNNDHKANVQIAKELGLSEKIIELVNAVNLKLSYDYMVDGDFVVKIINYADWRVDPHGIVSYDERMAEAKRRYKGRKDFFVEEERLKLIACGKEIEKQIFTKCKIKPEDINDQTVAPVISSLKNFVIE